MVIIAKTGGGMNREISIASRRRSTILALTMIVAPLAIQAEQNNGGNDQGKGQPPPTYNPYPPGILPRDLVSEIERVRREVRFIFDQALAQWRALPPPNLTGQPPTLQGSGYDMVQTLAS